MYKRLTLLLCAALATGAFVAACGGGSSDNGGSGGGGGESTSGAKVIDVNSMKNAKGSVTYCQGKDTTGQPTDAIKTFNAQHNGVTVKMLEFSTSADEQRSQFIQRQQAKSGECDIFYSDVVWTAEFASQKWLYDMTPYVTARKADFIPATLQTITYDGKNWGVPQTDRLGVPLLPRRPDQDPAGDVAGGLPGGQGQQRHRLSGRALRGPDLRLPRARLRGGRPGALAGRQEVGDQLAAERQGAAVHGRRRQERHRRNGVTTYMEEESRRYCESGKATFMRNWPYAYALGEKKGTKVAGKFKVMPFPTFEGGGKAGILGGHNLVVSVYSKNPGAALKFIDFWSSPEEQTREYKKYSQAPTTASIYDDPAIQKMLPVRGRAEGGRLAGQGAAGLAGLPADLAGDLQQRQCGSVGQGVAAGRDEDRRQPDQQGAGDLLGAMATAPATAGTVPARRRSRGIPERRLAVLMVTPSMALIALVALWPVIYGIWLSMHQYSLIQAGLSRWASPLGLGNYTTS